MDDETFVEEIETEDNNNLDAFVIKRLREIMEQRHLTRYKLWQLTGITQPSLSTLFSGRCAPSLATIEKLCKGLDISVSDFFKKEGEENYPLSSDERQLLKCWHELDKVQKKMSIAYAEGMLTQSKLSKL